MMNLRPIVLFVSLVATCALLTACASSGVKPVNPATVSKISSAKKSGKAVLVVYRPGNALGGLLSPSVEMDGKELVNISNGTVFVAAIPPGHHIFQIRNQESGTELTLKAGNSIYLKVEIVPGMWKGNGKLTQSAPEQGEFEAKRCRPIDSEQINDAAYR
jgi:hypothetical protein